MSATAYNHRSARARKARLNSRLGKGLTTADLALMGLLTLSALYLWSKHSALGLSVLGLDLLVGISYIWRQWDVADLRPSSSGLTASPVQIDQVAEPKLLARLTPAIDAPQLWAACTHQWEGVFLLDRLGVPASVVADTLKQHQTDVSAIWEASIELAKTLQASDLNSGIVIAATLLKIPEIQPILSHLKLKSEDVLSVARWQQRLKRRMQEFKQPLYFGGIARDWASGYTPLLDRFALNLTKEVENGYYRHTPTVHQPVINSLIELVEQDKPVALVGPIGSGRTAIVYALAERLLKNDQVGSLSYYQVVSLNASTLISTDGRLEDLVLNLFVEAVQARNTILFLDEAELFFSTGTGSVDISQILLPILQRNSLKIVFAMSDHDWQSLVATRPALSGALQRLVVPEPTPQETVAIIQDAAIGIEHKVKAITSQEAVTEAIKLATRYLPESAFPGKGISVLDAASRFAQEGLISAASVQQAVQEMTGAKVTTASAPERSQLLNLEDQIHQRMVNQDRAVKVVAAALRRSRAGVASSKRPVGSFLFLGPTGVGKTELAKALAAIYFGGEEAMIRLDMTEYQQPSDVSRLLNPASSTETGDTLVSAVRQNPSSVILLDEIEKAHPDILNLLLQLLDEGNLTDSDGRAVSFRDAIVIATSNAAADEIRSRIEKGEKLEAFEEQITENLIASHQFKPELLNRFDEIVVFRPLTKPELSKIVQLLLTEVNATLSAQNVQVALTEAASTWLVDNGYHPEQGARPLRRTIQRSVENLVAERLLAGKITPGQTVTLDASDLQSEDSAAA